MGWRPILRISLGAASLVALVVGMGACSSGGGGSTATQDSGAIGCQTEGETYAQDMVKAGTKGMYTFTLVTAAPAPPGLDTNVWTMKVVDATGQPPPASELSAVPYMPQMGHGTGQIPQFMSNADGSFTVSNIYLFMDGLWTVTFDVTTPPASGSSKGTVVDTVVYTFCING
jgi:YtkA-like